MLVKAQGKQSFCYENSTSAYAFCASHVKAERGLLFCFQVKGNDAGGVISSDGRAREDSFPRSFVLDAPAGEGVKGLCERPSRGDGEGRSGMISGKGEWQAYSHRKGGGGGVVALEADEAKCIQFVKANHPPIWQNANASH